MKKPQGERNARPPGRWSAWWAPKNKKLIDSIRARARGCANWPGADPEDFASEVIERLLDYEGRGEEIKNLRALAHQVTRWAAGHEAHRSLRMPVIINRADLSEDAPSQDRKTNPQYLVERDELVEAIVKAIARLPPVQKEIVLGRLIENLSHAELAASLGMNEATVRSNLSRGLERVRADVLKNTGLGCE